MSDSDFEKLCTDCGDAIDYEFTIEDAGVSPEYTQLGDMDFVFGFTERNCEYGRHYCAKCWKKNFLKFRQAWIDGRSPG